MAEIFVTQCLYQTYVSYTKIEFYLELPLLNGVKD